jgi:phosphoglycerate dehydrogenase-like enzyme
MTHYRRRRLRAGGASDVLNCAAMEIGFVGLGRMGLNMTTRLVRGGHRVVAHDRALPRAGPPRSAFACSPRCVRSPAATR